MGWLKSPERCKKISESQKKRWSHPMKRRDLLEKIKEGRENIIGPLQAQILNIIKENGWLFFSEIVKLSGLEKVSCDQVVLRLHKRKLVKR